MPQSKLAIIHRLRSEIEVRESQLVELESEMLEEVLTNGPPEDPDFECHAVRNSERGRIVYELRVSKRRRPAVHAHGPAVEIHPRLAMLALGLLSCAAALNLP